MGVEGKQQYKLYASFTKSWLDLQSTGNRQVEDRLRKQLVDATKECEALRKELDDANESASAYKRDCFRLSSELAAAAASAVKPPDTAEVDALKKVLQEEIHNRQSMYKNLCASKAEVTKLQYELQGYNRLYNELDSGEYRG